MHADALAVLEEGTAAKRLRDPLGVKEQQARLFLALGRQEAAEAAYRGLIAINTENYNYHAGLQAALKLPTAAAAAAGNGSAPAAAAANGSASSGSEAPGLSEEQRQRLTAVYVELQEQYPRSSAARRMPLDFLVGCVS
jgi:peptide alpha-N-acetyltransferase